MAGQSARREFERREATHRARTRKRLPFIVGRSVAVAVVGLVALLSAPPWQLFGWAFIGLGIVMGAEAGLPVQSIVAWRNRADGEVATADILRPVKLWASSSSTTCACRNHGPTSTTLWWVRQTCGSSKPRTTAAEAELPLFRRLRVGEIPVVGPMGLAAILRDTPVTLSADEIWSLGDALRSRLARA